MPQRNAKDLDFLIDDTGGTLRNMSAHIANVTGLPHAREATDVTTLGKSGHTWQPTLQNVRFVLDGVYDDSTTDLTSPRLMFHNMVDHTTTRTFEYWPSGRVTGRPRWSGECWLLELEEPGRVGDYIRFRASFNVDNNVTLTDSGST